MNDKTNPADIRGISDPPDMGRLRPAEDVAAALARVGAVHGMYALLFGRDGGIVLDIGPDDQGLSEVATLVRGELAAVIRQSRAEGAAAALEEVADAFETSADENEEVAGHESVDGYHDRAKSLAIKAEAYAGIAALLRARIKTISDPPDMG